MTNSPDLFPVVTLRKNFASRKELHDYLREHFPEAAMRDDALSPIPGGKEAALARLSAVDAEAYGKTRNFEDGRVSRLSPYIRHGLLTLADVRDTVLDRVSDPWNRAYKFLQELAWRDYWQRVYQAIGKGIEQDRETIKTGYTRQDYSNTLPTDIQQGTTGLNCMDGFIGTLRETGYLHNHLRMYLASYIIHFRRIHWLAGARWFLTHLLDGDPASNHLSWQWVASTFGNKPYFFNRENLERYTKSRYCSDCPHAVHRTCPFDASYETLSERLFPLMPARNNAPTGRRFHQ